MSLRLLATVLIAGKSLLGPRIRAVIANGRLLDRAALDAMLERARTAPTRK
jgi:hypothetical protein